MRIKKCLGLLLCISLTVFVMVQHCSAADDDEDDSVDVEVEDEDTKAEKPKFIPPVLKGSAHLSESFNKKDDFKRWIVSEAKKDGAEEAISKYDGKWVVEEPRDSAVEGDLGLILKSKAKHHAVSRRLDRPFRFDGKPLVVQYEVRYQDGVDCGGAYIKLLSEEAKPNLRNFHDKTPYTIMFGPDKCGMDHKLHFIFRHKNPKTGELEEKHAKKPSGNIDKNFSDKKTHLYTLVVSPDNTFEVLVDNTVVNEGTLLDDFSPPVNPPKEIDDPDDKKPEDYDEREKIPDPDAVKPEDWDESEPEKIENPDATKPEGWLDEEEKLVPDPDAEKPADWDDDMDGEWEAPLIENPKCKEAPGCGAWERPMMENPKYKGKWRPAMIDNPDYKGVWKPRRIENPNYFEDLEPYKMTPITAVGLELWSMNDEVVFDNFIVTNDKSVAEAWATETWEVKYNAEKAASSSGKGFFNTLKAAADERPWMWALYIVILLLPVLLISICVCPRGGPIKPDQLAERKKTDAVSPDDQPTEEENAENKEESTDDKSEEKETKVGAGGDNPGNVKKSKASLEAEEENDDEDEEEEENIEESKGNESPRRSPRKRRSRKE